MQMCLSKVFVAFCSEYGSNMWPLNFQSDALPTQLSPQLPIKYCLYDSYLNFSNNYGLKLSDPLEIKITFRYLVSYTPPETWICIEQWYSYIQYEALPIDLALQLASVYISTYFVVKNKNLEWVSIKVSRSGRD